MGINEQYFNIVYPFMDKGLLLYPTHILINASNKVKIPFIFE